MNNSFAVTDIKEALSLNEFDALQAQLRMVPVARPVRRPPEQTGEPRLGGVLALFYYKNEELYLVLTRRRDDLNSHAGQVSFPGGKRENGESLVMTALRETEEEIGVPLAKVEVLGHLSTLYIPPSDFEVHPFVALYKDYEAPRFVPNWDEVAEIIEVPLRSFFDPAVRHEEPWELRGTKLLVPYYKLGTHKVWGATAMMISELVERLRLINS